MYVLCAIGTMCDCFIFFFKQKTAYEMRISDWSSDVCSSDLVVDVRSKLMYRGENGNKIVLTGEYFDRKGSENVYQPYENNTAGRAFPGAILPLKPWQLSADLRPSLATRRSEEHTSELQSLMRISYAVFCLNKKKDSPSMEIGSE